MFASFSFVSEIIEELNNPYNLWLIKGFWSDALLKFYIIKTLPPFGVYFKTISLYMANGRMEECGG